VAVRFRDIDALDHGQPRVILTYAETVRCDWFARAAGFASMADLPFIIASAHVEYKAPIPKSADVEVAMWVSRMGSKSWTFSYAVRDASTGVLFAQVETVQVAYDYAQRATMVIPAPVRVLLEGLGSG